ncbi:MAG: bifunctional UDP-N-acetylglucosamine diphosphorylase/glucosamine-1-phosphate N-acetyltransferase GlmU [Gammaproteobacteria bacterium]
MSVSVIILAAGKGTRMYSFLPKVLHCVGDKPLLQHVIDAARTLQPDTINVVYGHCGEAVVNQISEPDIVWVEQLEQLGTGHAVKQALPDIEDTATVLVLYGDVPLITETTLRKLIIQAEQGGLAVLTALMNEPTGYGRMIRDSNGKLVGIVEEKDATDDQRSINEINTGFLACNAGKLKSWLSQLTNNNAQGEYYLTDIVALAAKENTKISSSLADNLFEIQGINDRQQLAIIERHFQKCCAEKLMHSGVTLADPARFDLRGELNTGQDCFIDINAVFSGKVTLGNGVHIEPNCIIKDASIEDGVYIKANTVIDNAYIGKQSIIGPFARIRPETVLDERVHIGNFVEIKKSNIQAGSKVNHLSYIGDTEMGSDVNVGAGTITCNYDGANKHLTRIGDNVFIGSDSQLIAPVTVNDGSTIGAGSTITKDTPASELTLSRAPQQTIMGWIRPRKAGKK